jgi:hypothetical protein
MCVPWSWRLRSDLAEFIMMVRRLLWHMARFLWTVESSNRRLPPRQGPIWYYQSWTWRPTPLPLQPSIPVTQGRTRWWRACRRICLVLLHTVHVSFDPGSLMIHGKDYAAAVHANPATFPVSYSGKLFWSIRSLKVTNRSLKQRGILQ